MKRILLLAFLSSLLAAAAPAQLTSSSVTTTCSEDFYQADTKFSLAVDGVMVAASTACTARNNPAGTLPATPQTNTFTGSWDPTLSHVVTITFLNDAYGGPGLDRNLYIISVAFNGTTLPPPKLSGNPSYPLAPAGAILARTGDNGQWSYSAAGPVITTQPQSLTVNASASAMFSVVATGATGYQWQRNGTAISGATSASYTIASTVSADSGAVFKVVVSNASGSVTSNPATLTVQISANLDTGRSTFTTTVPGYDALAKCSSVPCSSHIANSSGTPTLEVVVPTTGGHQATLNWTASTTPTVKSYNIYRSTTNGGPYQLLTSVTAPTLTYTDLTVVSGTTYYYVVTAVDPAASPTESVYSNQGSATIP